MYKCVNGHDRCYSTPPGPECPTCEKKFTLFCDLDGVLCDFDKAVMKITGKRPHELPLKKMWGALAAHHNFYGTLDWMPDGRELWEGIEEYDPIILTGKPLGNWTTGQKYHWCNKHLNYNPEKVIVCYTSEKPNFAFDTAILIDDRPKIRDKWVEKGGIFIHHKSAKQSLAELNDIIGSF